MQNSAEGQFTIPAPSPPPPPGDSIDWCIMNTVIVECSTLDDQTQGDSKPAGQPEHASLNQRQLRAPK